jgi:flagellar M-ring protein FliF
LTPAQKATVSAFAALSIVAVFIVSLLATRPSQATIFSNLGSEDAGAIVAKLEEKKVTYTLSADGTAIKVPEKDVYKLRMDMVNEGLPQGGNVGFELLDKNSFGMTEFNQKVNYQRALQGELARTIKQLSQVADARVLITVPEDKLFSEDKQEPTASVTLKLRPGVTLSDDQVATVVHLVSSSVEGLKPNNVTVADTNGNMLSAGGEESGMATARMSTAQTKLKRDYERMLQQDLQTMLDRIVGSGKSIVRVAAEMNFDHKEITSQVYEPLEQGRGVLVSEDQTEETYDGSGPKVGGSPGVPNNLQGASIRRVAGNGDNYRRVERSSKYEVTKRVEQTVAAPGNVEKLSVAVMLDEKVESRQVPAIQRTVQAAAGIDDGRGDIVTVQRAKFDNTELKKQEQEMTTAARTATYTGIGKNVLAVLLLIGFMLFLRSLFKQMKVPATVSKTVVEPELQPEVQPEFNEPEIPSTYVPFEATVDGPSLDDLIPSELSDSFDTLEMPSAPSEADSVRPEQIAKERPEDVARLIRDWITEK